MPALDAFSFASLCAALACSVVACSSSTASPVSDDTGAVTDTGPTIDTGTVMMEAAAVATCDDYCATIAENCTNTNEVWIDTPTCMTECAAFPTGLLGDTSGNTLGCRDFHAGAASSSPSLYCPHAGPLGGGVCGDPCDGFCEIEMNVCVGVNRAYTSMTACTAACSGFVRSAMPSILANSSGNTLECRMYHAEAAAKDAASATLHCPFTSKTSTMCM